MNVVRGTRKHIDQRLSLTAIISLKLLGKMFPGSVPSRPLCRVRMPQLNEAGVSFPAVLVYCAIYDLETLPQFGHNIWAFLRLKLVGFASWAAWMKDGRAVGMKQWERSRRVCLRVDSGTLAIPASGCLATLLEGI